MIEYEYEQGKDVSESFGKLFELLSLLRSPEGCPWDRKQTASASLMDLKAEIFEAADEITKGDSEGIAEEVGDILINCVMLLVILQDTDRISPLRILDAASRKLISRHPHVFGNAKAADSREALEVWNSVKRAEGKTADKDDFFSRIPKSCQPFDRAGEVLRKAIGAGFTWPDAAGVLDQAASEIEEARKEICCDEPDGMRARMEIGDAIFSAMAIARFMSYDPEECLSLSSEKFEKRFNIMRSLLERDGTPLGSEKADLATMDRCWKLAKSMLDKDG